MRIPFTPIPRTRSSIPAISARIRFWIFKFDPALGALLPAEVAPGRVPPGSGPRHLAFHPRNGCAYVCHEMGLTVTAFRRDAGTGALRPLETVHTGPDLGPHEKAKLAGIFCHPSGKWLYVSNRGPDTISVFAIRGDGTLERVQIAAAQVKVPRGFGLDPTGRWLIAGGQADDTIAVLEIDPETGLLSPTENTARVVAPVCVLFAGGVGVL